jgi:linoleoyl-CoA desaturase
MQRATIEDEAVSTRTGEMPRPAQSRPGAAASEEERLAQFTRALDELRAEVEAKLGSEDAAYIHRVQTVSHVMQVVGRSLIHFSIEPVGFGAGVAALWVHKLLELMEIGHGVLHGAYDKLPGAEAYRAETFVWRAPIDEKSWRTVHNLRHHQYTNIPGRDPDLDFGALRLTKHCNHKLLHALQPVSNYVTWLAFAAAINLHVTGLLDVYFGRGEPPILPDRRWATLRDAHRAALRKFVGYYGKEYVFFPLLAGPFFWKTLLGNVLSDMGRDVWAAAMIYCGHVGATDFPPGTRAKGRAAWYALQAEAAYDVEVPKVVSILCGGLDYQIEHHLFPRLPPNRLREIRPRVRAICEEHGVVYRSASWPRRLRDVSRSLRALAAAAGT